MKKLLNVTLCLLLSIGLFPQASDTITDSISRNTRNFSLKTAIRVDSSSALIESPVLKSMDGIGVDQVIHIYKLNRLQVDSLLEADSLNPNFWRVYGGQFVNMFILANQGPETTMAISLPWFVAFFIIVILILSIKTIFIKPILPDPVKPENDPNQYSPENDENYGSEPDNEENDNTNSQT